MVYGGRGGGWWWEDEDGGEMVPQMYMFYQLWSQDKKLFLQYNRVMQFPVFFTVINVGVYNRVQFLQGQISFK